MKNSPPIGPAHWLKTPLKPKKRQRRASLREKGVARPHDVDIPGALRAAVPHNTEAPFSVAAFVGPRFGAFVCSGTMGVSQCSHRL